MPDFFLEIGTEEIPSGFMTPALDHLGKELARFFEKNRIRAGEPRCLGTPRRLVVAVPGVEERQADVVETHHGPNVKVAFDGEGNPTRAAIGFARGKGIDVSQLSREKTPKGEVVCARVEQIGQPTDALLNTFLPGLLADIPFPKKMRWGSRKTPFARPMHWIVALFGGTPLTFEFDGIPAAATSYGHRFLNPEPFQVDGLETYLKECQTHFLEVDPEQRKQSIVSQIRRVSGEVDGIVEEDAELLEEVNFLIEYPVAVRGDFPANYLELPKELLVMTMKHHQKYFPVVGDGGRLLPHFITISNMSPEKGNQIKNGNERVLRARLEDARFFFEEDQKRKLESYLEELKGVIFQKDLGTSYEKVIRIIKLAGTLAEKVCPEKRNQVERAARLCKADLVTQMVYEFPELQGIMGGYYAAHSGEDLEVAEAIKEHYRPAFAGDDLPSSDVAAAVAVGDKLDTILGCIGVGLIPSGSEDPYGLRRHSLGIIQILLDRNWQVSLDDLVETGVDLIRDKAKLSAEQIRTHTLELFSQRYKSFLTAEGFPYDAIDAVLATGIDSLVDVKTKTSAFSELKQQPHFEPLAIAFRRVVSILNDEAIGEVDPSMLEEPAEQELFRKYQDICRPVEDCIRRKEFGRALEKIVEIKGAVDGFFDQVMVMVEDDALRQNRMRLLCAVSRLFSELADFSRIVLKKS